MIILQSITAPYNAVLDFLMTALSRRFEFQLKSIHWVNSFARSSFFEKHIILTKPFQPARADISCSFFEKHIIVQNFLLSEWALVFKY